jgi:E3 ubiquitin-protein ligase HECTD1
LSHFVISRHDEGHREVANILQSPADWLTVANANDEEAVAAEMPLAAADDIPEVEVVEGAAAAVDAGEEKREEEEETKDKKENAAEEQQQGPKGDPEMIPVYAKSLLPMFCHTFHSTMIVSVKKSSLGLIKKIVHYMEPSLLTEVCVQNRHIVGEIVEVLTAVLDNEEDEEGHLTCLLIIQDLMVKDGDGVFLEQFAKLGLYAKVHSLAEESDNSSSTDDLSTASEASATSGSSGGGDGGDIMQAPAAPVGVVAAPVSAVFYPVREDAKEICQGRGYTWKDWSLARGRDCLYIWSDAAALELSNGSNGWFRFILDGKLATMYSSGSPEGGSDSSENRGEFLEKLQRARAAVTASAIDAAASTSSAMAPSLSLATPIFSKKCADVIAVGNWNLSCTLEGELTIINSDGQQQATILKEDLPGFLFQSNRGTRHTFTAETSLGPEFAAGWTSGVGGRKAKGRLKCKMEAVKQRIRTTARLIYENYFRAAQAQPRGVVATLANIVTKIDTCCQKQMVSKHN